MKIQGLAEGGGWIRLWMKFTPSAIEGGGWMDTSMDENILLLRKKGEAGYWIVDTYMDEIILLLRKKGEAG